MLVNLYMSIHGLTLPFVIVHRLLAESAIPIFALPNSLKPLLTSELMGNNAFYIKQL